MLGNIITGLLTKGAKEGTKNVFGDVIKSAAFGAVRSAAEDTGKDKVKDIALAVAVAATATAGTAAIYEHDKAKNAIEGKTVEKKNETKPSEAKKEEHKAEPAKKEEGNVAPVNEQASAETEAPKEA